MYLGWPFNLSIFFSDKKGKVASVMFKILDGFSFKDHFLTSNLKILNWSKWILVLDILIHFVHTLLT